MGMRRVSRRLRYRRSVRRSVHTVPFLVTLLAIIVFRCHVCMHQPLREPCVQVRTHAHVCVCVLCCLVYSFTWFKILHSSLISSSTTRIICLYLRGATWRPKMFSKFKIICSNLTCGILLLSLDNRFVAFYLIPLICILRLQSFIGIFTSLQSRRGRHHTILMSV